MPEISGTASHRGRQSRSDARSIGPHVAGRTLRARDCPIYRHARPLESQARASSPALRLERPHPGAALPWTRTMGGPSSPARSGGRLAVPSLTLLTGLLDGSRSVRVEVTWLFARERDLDALLGALVIDARRYSPNKVTSQEIRIVSGEPDPERISTSYVERHNLTMRMSMRRFTRLTNAFSKKVENHAAAISLNMMWQNFGKPLKALANPYPRTPAMAAGVSDHIWTCEEIAALLD